MSKLSYQCGWKSISPNEQKNQTISTRHLLLTWIMGKQTCLLLREVVSLSSKLQRKSNQNPITVCLLGKSLKPVPFSPKLTMSDDSNTQVESPSVSGPGWVFRGKELSSGPGEAPGCKSPLGTAGPFPRLCQTHHFL